MPSLKSPRSIIITTSCFFPAFFAASPKDFNVESSEFKLKSEYLMTSSASQSIGILKSAFLQLIFFSFLRFSTLESAIHIAPPSIIACAASGIAQIHFVTPHTFMSAFLHISHITFVLCFSFKRFISMQGNTQTPPI